MRWAGHVALRMCHAYRNLGNKENIKMNIIEIGRVCGQDSCGPRALLKTVVFFPVS